MIDANGYAFLDHLARAPQVTLSAGDAVSRLDTALPLPLLRSTYRLRCVSDNALSSLVEVAGPGRGPWWLGPSTTPAGAGSVLEDFGLRQVDELSLMSAALDDLPSPDPSLTVVEARTPAQRRAWAAAYASGHGQGVTVAAAWAQVMIALGDGPLRHYVATVDGTPVASVSMLLAEGVAGLHLTATAPLARGRGLATALSLHALADARDAGYTTAVLGAESPAVSRYQRLGFRTHAVMRIHA